MAVLTSEFVSAKLREFHGNMAAVARAAGVTRQAVYKYIESNDELKAVKQECRESMIDNAESSLYRAIVNGEAWAVCFFLKTQGKPRGYVERQEVTGADGKPITFIDASTSVATE